MSSNTIRIRNLSEINNENPVKNIKNSLISNRKKNALKVLTNTVQSTKTTDGKSLKQLKVLPMKKFDTEIKSKPLLLDTSCNQNDELNHFNCALKEKDFLPSSMTCNIGMLSNFFKKKSDESDWFLEDYNNVMINKIKNTFEHFGEPDVVEQSFSSLPLMDFPEMIFV